MLIRFKVENHRSFDDCIEFSMVAGKVQKHPSHIVKRKMSWGVDLLRMGLVYGANASGKSNFVKALDFGKFMVVKGVKAKALIPRKPFKLTANRENDTSLFEYEFISNGRSFDYGFRLDSKKIHEEWLTEIHATVEKELFRRKTDENGNAIVSFGQISKKKDLNLLNLIAESTPANRLFLNQCSESTSTHFDDAFKWFYETLIVIFPNTYHTLYSLTHDDENEFGEMLVEQLSRLGTGVSGFKLQSVSNDTNEIPKEYLEELEQNLLEGEAASFQNLRSKKRYFIKKEGEHFQIYKLMLCHKPIGCEYEVDFEMNEESDGTNRLLDLLPMLFKDAELQPKVYVIDELDRSLHPNLSQDFLSSFIESNDSNQIIVTTHESSLLDLDFIRRDEIWFVEKDHKGSSSIYSLEEFAPRYDKDIRKGYMLGRFGAIPMISSPNFKGE